jgi:sec-independent protein translocase protein TatB
VFDLDPEKILLLGIFALVVLGPNRLPEAARSLGRMLAHLRSVSTSLQTEVRDALGEPGEEITAAVRTLRSTSSVKGNVRRAVTTSLTGPPPARTQASAPPPVDGGPASGPADSTAPDDPSLN